MNRGSDGIREDRGRALLSQAIAIACLTIGSEAARADVYDTLNLTLAETLRHDNNLFRLPGGRSPSPAAGSSSRSDNIRSESVTLTLDKQLSLQKIHFSVSFTTHRYRNFGFLNHQAKAYDGYWHWQVTPHLRGQIAIERVEAMNNFADYQGFQRNVRTTTNRRIQAEYGVFGNWRLTAGANHGASENSASFVQTGDTTNQGVSVGIRYVTLADNWAALTSRVSQVEWMNRPLDLVNQFDVSADQRNTELRVRWQPTGKTTVDGFIDRITRRHANVPSRNYSGTGGRVDVTWVGSGKTRFQLGVGRDFEPWWEASSSYARRDWVSVAPMWQLTARTRIRLNLERNSRDFLGPVSSPIGVPRRDNGSVAALAFEWAPQRNLTLATSLQSEGRSSNQTGLAYDDKTMMFSAQIGF